MENKSNSLNRIKRQQREKVLRFSIRKYSFGAASVAVAALMFLGAHVVSADVVDAKNQPAIGAPNPKEEESPLLEPAPIAKNEETKETEKVEVAKETEEREKPSENKEAVEANPLTNGTSTSTITVTKDASGDEVTEKQTLDKSQLQASITNVQELLDKVNKEKAPASTLAAIQADLETANSVLNNNSLELTQAEIDAIAKKLNEKIFVLSSMPKANAPEKVVKEGKNTIANTGSHDSRNGQSMAQGTNFRANGEINQGALTNIRYFASVDPGTNGGNPKKNDNPEFTRNKTDIKATYVKDSEGKWIVYDVYFNNDGHKMVERSYQQHYYFQGPFNIMDLKSDGGYKDNTIKDLTFTRYQNTGGRRLSDGGQGFTKYGNTAVITNPAYQQRRIFGSGDTFYDPNSGVTGGRNQPWEVFKHNQDEADLNLLTKNKQGSYPGLSYYLGVDVHRDSIDYAMHMHVKIKLRDNVTPEEVATYGRVYAASVTKASNTNQSYIVGAMGTRLQNEPEAKLYPIIGKEVTKEVGAPIENVENPVGSGFVTRDNGTKDFPGGMSWEWLNGQPNTNTAGVFKPQAKATYSDNSSNTATATLIVKPKKPTITTSVVNKKGLTGQQITVNVGSGVKDNSIVKLYEGDRVIGRGTTHGETGTVIVQGALSGNPITAETLVNNGGEVTSVRSDAVRPTEAPDTQAPTLTVSKDQTVVEGETVTFTVTAKDDKHVNLIVDDFTKKYGSRLVNSQVTTNYEKDTATEKILTINIKTTAQDVGKPNTITFNATDNANHSAEPVTFTFNVTPRDNQKPEATLNGVRLTENANTPIFTVYRGATFNPELKVWDNSGVISKVTTGNLPYGITASTFTSQTGKTEKTPYTTRLSSGTVVDTQTLGEHIGTLHVEGSSSSDSRDFKFKYRVVDIETKNVDENSIAKVSVASTLNKANSSKNIDAHNYLKVVDSQDKADRGNNYLPQGMTWTWKDRDGNQLDRGTTLDNSGKYTRTATAIFPAESPDGKFSTNPNSTRREVFAPAEIKRQVILAVTPTAPIVEGKENGSVTITPPTRPDSTNKQDIDTINLTYVPTGKTSPETVIVTKSGNTWTATVNGKATDKISVSPEGVVTISDAEVADKTEVTAKVSKNIDGVLTLESPVAIGTANGPLAAEVTNPAPVPEKAQITPVTVVTPNKPGSSITVDGKINGLTVDEEGKLKGTPEVNDWKPKEEEHKITIPVKVKHGDEIVTKDVPVTIQRDTDGDAIPDVKDPDDDNDGIPDEEEIKNGTDPKVPTTQTPTIGITRKENGDAIVTPTKPGGGTYPRGTTVTIPGNDNTPIEVTIGNDGSGTVPNDKLPKTDKPGTGTVTEPNKAPSKPVEVTTPARKKPTVALDQDPDTGEVTVTPKKPDGTLYPENTKVEIPGKDKDHPITVTIGKDGKGKVPNSELPEGKVPGTSKITVPGKPAVEVPVETPGKIIPGAPTTEQPVAIEINQKPNGDAVVTPKKEDGKPYPPGTKVEIPGEDKGGNPITITVTIGDNGSGEVPNDKLPKKDISGTGTVTEPKKNPSQPVNVTTPSKLIPTVELDQDPDTGEVTVTPKKPDGTLYPENTKVEIPGKDKDHPITITIGKDGKGKVPNSKLPEGKVPGTSKITVPGKPAVEVPNVTTPAKVTPATPTTEKPSEIEITRKPNGDAVVTPKKPDGSTYPSGSKVVIPGENNTPIEVTIGDNGSGEVPNDKLPKKDVPGTGTVTEPNKKPSQPVDVTTPARKTPTLDVERDPKTGDVTVTPKRPDGTPYPPGTTVEIPGENGPITVEIGQDGKGKVPNDKLPKKAVPGTGKITEPGKPTEEVPVETPAHKTPTLDVERDPKTGDVTVTPKRPDGSTYPPGTKVEIPGENGPITVEIGQDGKGKVPNGKLPKKDVPGTGKITEPGQPAVEVPNVTTPGKFTPETPVTEQPGKIEITQQPNGNAIVTPKKPDGTTYPPGTKVEIPGENGTTITVTIGDNGSGEVPNDKLPKGNVPGKGTVTEPNKKPSQPVDVTTPARKTPTLDVERDPETGDVTVTPKKPDGTTYPPGTTVEIPGKDGKPITVTIGEDGKGKVPNSDLPDVETPGTGKITEPGKPAVEVPNVTTPGKFTPETPTDTNPVAPVTPDTNGDSGQDKPAPATPTPNADPVDTKTTNDNGAKSNDSQNVLPNTGTESNAALASLGLLGLLSGFGLVARKKKED